MTTKSEAAPEPTAEQVERARATLAAYGAKNDLGGWNRIAFVDQPVGISEFTHAQVQRAYDLSVEAVTAALRSAGRS